MNGFEYYNPVKVVFNVGAINNIGKITKEYAKNVLLVSYSDVSFFQKEIDLVENLLIDEGITVTRYFNVGANPTLLQAREGIEIAKKNDVELIVGFGGGSVMDCAKIIAASVFLDSDIADMISFSHSKSVKNPPKSALPTIMVPTIAATGSEMNPTAVVTDEKTNRKSYVWAPNCLYPKVAVLDPNLTIGLPPFQTACGAIDSIAHIVEGYFNGDDSNLDLQDRMQEGVITAVLNNLPKVIKNPSDTEARGVLMWAASIALNGWVLSGTYGWAPMHQMGHAVSGKFGATHGATLACMMLAWMRFFANRADNKRYAQFSQRIFGSDIKTGADKFEQYMKNYGVPTKTSDLGVSKTDIDDLVNTVVEVSFNENNVLGSNPCITKEEVREIYLLSL